MKNLVLLIAIAAIFSFNARGQAKEAVPENVKSAFSQKFPDATNVKWDKENATEWEAEFKIGGKKYSANFDNMGTWMETEYEINADEIPAAVKTTLDKDFTGYKIEESEVSETAKGKLYEFELEKAGEEIEADIDMSGKIVNKEQPKEETEDEEDAG
jgi:uncharacterized membrane protein YkoI